MANAQRKERRHKELIELGRQAKTIADERDRLRAEAAKWREIASQQAEDLAQVNICCEGLRAELVDLRKQEADREAHFHEIVDHRDVIIAERDARIHELSSDLELSSKEVTRLREQFEAMNGHDIKTLRRRLHEKSEQIKKLQTTVSQLEMERRRAEA